MPSVPPPSAPAHLLRSHLSAVNALHISEDNERLYSGDASGIVVVTSTRSFRPVAQWEAHKDSILGISEWDRQILTHGRDNKLHVWTLLHETDAQLGESAVTPALSEPMLKYSMDVNALNYCRFSLLPMPSASEPTALIALPNLVESSLSDIWELPSQKRLHAAIGKQDGLAQADGRGENATGIIMGMELIRHPHPHVSDQTQLRLLCAYENGGVTMWAYKDQKRPISIEGIGWEKLWSVRLHKETVMAMSVSRDKTLALTVSADHLIGRYDLEAARQQEDVTSACTVHRTKHPGNGSIAIRDDGRVCAIGGWDGRVRLFSTGSLKPLGTLEYHKKSCQCAVFARSSGDAGLDGAYGEDSEDEMSEEEKLERSRWLIVGSQDTRVSIWPLISFEKRS